ncbi:MAG: hypothetical protein ACK4KW_13815 [Gemmobacter sp.]
MIRTMIFAATAALVSAPLAAQPTDAQKASLQSAIEAHGCKVSAENNEAILAAAGLTEADAATVVQALLDAGNAVIEGGELVLKSGTCQ